MALRWGGYCMQGKAKDLSEAESSAVSNAEESPSEEEPPNEEE